MPAEFYSIRRALDQAAGMFGSVIRLGVQGVECKGFAFRIVLNMLDAVMDC